jgi:DNA-binding transcriptional LysR family regulator
VDPDDLQGHDVIAFSAGLEGEPAAEWLEARARGAIVHRTSGMPDMLAAAVAGVGLAALPCFVADAVPALERLSDRVLATRRLVMAGRREGRMSSSIVTVACFVADVINEHKEQLAGTPHGGAQLAR